jgi:hypothetical protein
MSEESLKLPSIDKLCYLMIKAIDEYHLLEKLPGRNNELEQKRAELFILHKVITDKKAESVH